MKHMRRRLFVDPAFQGRLLARLVVYWAIYHVALWHLLFLFTMIGASLMHDPASPSKTWGTQYQEFFRDHLSIIICFLVMLPILGRDLLKFSHRLAGPLVRFRNTMQDMIDGKPVEPVTLRKYDLPSQFLSVFNDMIRVWKERSPQASATPAVEEDKELELVGAE